MRIPACLGGDPLFPFRYELAPPSLPDPEKLSSRLKDAFSSRWLSNFGRYVREFEEKLSELFQVASVATVCNATLGLMIALETIEAHGEVIVPSYTFPATGQAALWAGGRLVFADLDPERLTLSADSVRASLTADTRAIVPMHCFGMPADIEKLQAVADSAKVYLLCDAAEAVGTRYQGRPLPGRGDLDVISFHATKILSIGEGGAILGNDSALIEEARARTNFGFDHKSAGISSRFGLNAKMAEIPAILGLAQIERLDEMLEKRSQWTSVYKKTLDEVPGLAVLKTPDGCEPNHQFFNVQIAPRKFGMPLETLIRALRHENILSRAYFSPPCHRQPSFVKKGFQVPPEGLPETERACESNLCLPMQPDRCSSEARQIAECILRLHEKADDINEVFPSREAVR